MDRNPAVVRDSDRPGVALRKESVDRNLTVSKSCREEVVALRKESVDRNINGTRTPNQAVSRSPQGERG